MKENLTKGILWNRAATAGVALGLVSSAYLYLTQSLSGASSVWMTILNFLLWGIKFAGCIWLMMFFMKRLVSKYNVVDNRATFRFGAITALCSSLIFSAFALANVLIINPGLISETMETAMQAYGSMLDSNSLAVLDRMEDMMPQMIFFSNLVYCSIYGIILSLILSRGIPSKNPFADSDAGIQGSNSSNN